MLNFIQSVALFFDRLLAPLFKVLRLEPLYSYLCGILRALFTVAVGLSITTKKVFVDVKGVTIEYPFKKLSLPEGYRGMLFNDIDECITCKLCAVACPVNCIYIEGHKHPDGEVYRTSPGGQKIKIKLNRYDMDMSLCMFCGLCTEACPTGSLFHTKEYEYSSRDREGLFLRFVHPKDDDTDWYNDLMAKRKAEKEAQKAAEAAEGSSSPAE